MSRVRGASDVQGSKGMRIVLADHKEKRVADLLPRRGVSGKAFGVLGECWIHRATSVPARQVIPDARVYPARDRTATRTATGLIRTSTQWTKGLHQIIKNPLNKPIPGRTSTD